MISRTIRPVVSYFMFCAMVICAVCQQNVLAAPFIPGGKLKANAFTLREMPSASPALVQKLNAKTSRADNTWKLMDIYFTPLLDQSGYVGVVNINPTNGMTGYEMMRSANAVICLWYCPAYASAIPGSNTLYFKSVTVTRL